MRVIILRLTALLLIAIAACAQEMREVVTYSTVSAPHTQFLVTLKTSNGTVENRLIEQPAVLSMTQYRSLTVPLTKRTLRLRDDSGPCYFIRSYVMKRQDDTDVMNLDHITTCTPMSRFQMKKTVRVVPASRR